jgi:hypothetical protein
MAAGGAAVALQPGGASAARKMARFEWSLRCGLLCVTLSDLSTMTLFRTLFTWLAAAALAVITAMSPAFAQTDKPIVNPYGQFLAGDGLKIEIATYLEKNQNGMNDMLVKITGAAAYEAGIDGKTLRYSAEPAGTGYNLKRDGRNLMSVRSPYGRWQQIEVYLAGRTYQVTPREEMAERVMPLHLLTDYRQNGGK